jgi:hypothetical protein
MIFCADSFAQWVLAYDGPLLGGFIKKLIYNWVKLLS